MISSRFQIYTEFFFAFAAVIMIGVFQELGTQLWPFAFMLFLVLVYSGKYGRVDLTMTNTLARFFVEQDESLLLVDMIATIAAQFVGSFLGSLVYCGIWGKANMFFGAMVPAADDRWRTLLAFALLHGFYYQAVAAYKKSTAPERVALLAPKPSEENPQASSLERNLGLAFAYASVAVAFQGVAAGSFGGINLDIGRMLGSKLLQAGTAGDVLAETWWIFLFAPIIGVVQAKVFSWLETQMECDNKTEASKPSEVEVGGGAVEAVGKAEA